MSHSFSSCKLQFCQLIMFQKELSLEMFLTNACLFNLPNLEVVWRKGPKLCCLFCWGRLYCPISNYCHMSLEVYPTVIYYKPCLRATLPSRTPCFSFFISFFLIEDVMLWNSWSKTGSILLETWTIPITFFSYILKNINKYITSECIHR